MRFVLLIICLSLLDKVIAADVLSLQDARDAAMRTHPRIAAANFTALAAHAGVQSADAAYYPQLTGVGTSAWARHDVAPLAAGALSNSSVFDRTAVGIQGTQLITDFGRTNNLVAEARFNALAQDRVLDEAKQEILLAVDQTFFSILQAQAIEHIAIETVSSRQTVVDQVSALARHQLRSDLDVGFANVSLEEGRLLLAQANDEVSRGYIELSQLMSDDQVRMRPLRKESIALTAIPEVSDLIRAAQRGNPRLAQLQAQRNALYRQARASADQQLPTVSVVGAAGYILRHDTHLPDNYAAAALNLSVPLFNGFAYTSQRDQFMLQAQAVDKTLADEQARLESEIRIAVERLSYLKQNVTVSGRLSEQAHRAYALADARYRLGSSSIIEWNQAQLNQTEADIGLTRASYDFRIQEATIDFYLGYAEVLNPEKR
jgi:outer membrane protein